MEKNLIVNNKELNHGGFFIVNEIFSTINRAIEERGYTKKEKRSEETVTPSGKYLYLELRPFKVVTNYITLMIKIKINLNHITETVKEIDGKKTIFQNGEVHIAFDAWSLTDYEHRWGMKPFVYFMKALINKFIYKFPFEAGTISIVGGDTAYIYAQVKKLLNSYKKKEEKTISEEEVKKEIEEEVMKEKG